VKRKTSRFVLDAFAVALAQELGVVMVTGNPELKSVEELVHVEWLDRSADTQ
jgi:hypothetical protein